MTLMCKFVRDVKDQEQLQNKKDQGQVLCSNSKELVLSVMERERKEQVLAMYAKENFKLTHLMSYLFSLRRVFQMDMNL